MEYDDLFKRYTRLAYKIAQPFCRGFPKSADDIKSAALEGLCKGIQNVIQNKKFDFAGPVIYLTIKGYVLEEINKLPLIRIPASYIKRHRIYCYENNITFQIRDLYPEIFEGHHTPSEGFYYIKMKEMIEHLRLKEPELAVLHLRLEEQTVREIAEALHLSKTKVQQIIERIRKKWKRRFL